ncbi:MAG: hypothetical protein HOM11_12105 [Methylococcales bacterium]|jgi:hypothetical protein|nr:hypothetical protein [Methylococcales bacterium]MBT7443458.1 hypothetical protein [Methylococcales bacterium]
MQLIKKHKSKDNIFLQQQEEDGLSFDTSFLSHDDKQFNSHQKAGKSSQTLGLGIANHQPIEVTPQSGEQLFDIAGFESVENIEEQPLLTFYEGIEHRSIDRRNNKQRRITPRVNESTRREVTSRRDCDFSFWNDNHTFLER